MTKAVLILPALLISVACGKDERVDIDARSGATPLALARAAPSHLALTVNGEVKQEYGFRSADLSALATTRIRTREVTGDGEYLGAYAYTGIPVIHILEGVAPQKDDAAFDRPLDMVVTFTASNGMTSHFSYNEICMADDALPITLAFYREPVIPSKEPETYSAALRKSWAQLIKRVYQAEPLRCDCGGTLRVIAFITEHKVIRKILEHLEKRKTGSRAPPKT